MAKGMYIIKAYPACSYIDDICQAIQDAGGKCAYILHDQETYVYDDSYGHKSGDLKPPHWHILCTWYSGFPSWRQFQSLCRSLHVPVISRFECFVRCPWCPYHLYDERALAVFGVTPLFFRNEVA